MIIGIAVFLVFVAIVLVLCERARRRRVADEREISLRCQAIADLDGYRRAEHIVNETWTTPTHARPGRSSLDMDEDDIGAVLTTTCTKCGGSGTLTIGADSALCACCDGSGLFSSDISPHQRRLFAVNDCEGCDGLGWIIHGESITDCTTCRGTGIDDSVGRWQGW